MRSWPSLLLVLAACPDDPVPDIPSPCEEEDRAGPLAATDVFEGEHVTVDVLELDPEPVVVGLNTWRLGVPGAGSCTASLRPWMPDHGHSSPVGGVTAQADEVLVDELNLVMGGYWELTLALECPEFSDEVQLSLCVEP